MKHLYVICWLIFGCTQGFMFYETWFKYDLRYAAACLLLFGMVPVVSGFGIYELARGDEE